MLWNPYGLQFLLPNELYEWIKEINENNLGKPRE